MKYKFVSDKEVYYFEDDKDISDIIKLSKKITKFRLRLWLFNPDIKIYVNIKNKWVSILYTKYRDLYNSNYSLNVKKIKLNSYGKTH